MSEMPEPSSQRDWRTKPSDRFILKWIKCHLSARITPRLVRFEWLRPWMITLFSASLGVMAGFLFALGLGFLAGLTAAFSQILDGVDGQFARLTERASRAGAFMDSVIDRYADGAVVIGLVVYLVRFPVFEPLWVLLLIGALAVIGSSQISYTSARAESLRIDLGPPTLVSKGTRISIIAISGLCTPLWQGMPSAALLYLVLHTNTVVVKRLLRSARQEETQGWRGVERPRHGDAGLEKRDWESGKDARGDGSNPGS